MSFDIRSRTAARLNPHPEEAALFARPSRRMRPGQALRARPWFETRGRVPALLTTRSRNLCAEVPAWIPVDAQSLGCGAPGTKCPGAGHVLLNSTDDLDYPHLMAMAPLIGRVRVRVAWPSLPDSMTHIPPSLPTILPTWCGHTTTAPTPGGPERPQRAQLRARL